MKTIAAVALCLTVAFAPGLAAATEAAPIQVQYALTVGTDGKAKELVASQTLPAPLDQWIRERVGAYTFQPATVNGKPQAAETTLYLNLGSEMVGDGKSRYGINSLRTGPKLVRGRYEGYPQGAGGGYFIVTYDARGRVTEAKFDESSDSVGGRSFRKWGLALARSFRFKPETVAGHAMPGSGMIPIVFCKYGETCPILAPPLPGDGADLGGELVAKSVLQALPPSGS